MVDLNEYRVVWSAGRGMPGVSTFHSEGSPAGLQAKLITFFNAVKPYITGSIVVTVPNTGRIINMATGQATGNWVTGTQTAIPCSGSGAFHAAGGAVVNWNTGVFNAGRQLRGKTYLVPLVVGSYESDGTILGTTLTAIQNAGNALAGGTDPLVVYSRRLGLDGVVTSATVPDKAVVLRSRRD